MRRLLALPPSRIRTRPGLHRETFGDIVAFTPDQISAMQTEISRIQAFIADEQSQYNSANLNPLNHLLGPQADNLTMAKNTITQNQNILAQLQSSMDDVIESGDTDRLSAWFSSAATIGSPSDAAIFAQNIANASTANLVTTVSSQTASQVASAVKSPFGIPILVWVIGALGLFIVVKARK